MKTIGLEEFQKAAADSPISTSDAILEIDQTNEQLPLGEHNIELVVVDNSDNKSIPVTLKIVIVDTEKPTAIIELVDKAGKTIEDPKIPHGSGFILSGKKSTDIGGGVIVEYRWRLVK